MVGKFLKIIFILEQLQILNMLRIMNFSSKTSKIYLQIKICPKKLSNKINVLFEIFPLKTMLNSQK